MATYGTRLTTAGAVLLAKALNGKRLNFTRGAYGDAVSGNQVIIPTDSQQDALTELIHERMSLSISNYEIKENGDMVVTVSVKNARVAREFKIAEAGLFATDPDSGQELLYGYFYDTDGGKMYPANSAIALEYTVDLVTTIGNAENVTATIKIEDSLQPGQGLTRMGDTISANIASPTVLGSSKIGNGLHMKQDSITANTASETVLGSIKVGKGLYMSGDSLNASVESGDIKIPDIETMKSRLSQLEINQSNLYMKLEAEHALGGYANLLLVEDFIDMDCIDQTTVSINDYQADHFLKTTLPITGIETGADYTAVKGSMAAPLHVQTVVRRSNDGEFDSWRIAPSPGDYFNGDGTTIYRTTATFKDHTAQGPGEMKVHISNLAKKWYGEGATDAETVTFETTAANASKFRLVDDWDFTSNGYFTLG